MKKGEKESKDSDDFRIYFPQPNNSSFTFGRDVDINFKHGINALPESEQDGKGRVSIIIWGWTDNVLEEAGSPPMIGEETNKAETLAPADTPNSNPVDHRKKAKNACRREKCKAQQAKKQQERQDAR